MALRYVVSRVARDLYQLLEKNPSGINMAVIAICGPINIHMYGLIDCCRSRSTHSVVVAWWRHDMEKLSALFTLYASWIPPQRVGNTELWYFFHMENMPSAKLPLLKVIISESCPNFADDPLWPGYRQQWPYQCNQPIVLDSLWCRLRSNIIN